GIGRHLLPRAGGLEGLGCVVTTNMARRVLLEARSFWTGISAVLLTGSLSRMLTLPQPNGLLVQRVAEGSAAAAIGIRGGTTKATIGGTDLVLGGDIILECVGVGMGADAARLNIRGALAQLQARAPIKA